MPERKKKFNLGRSSGGQRRGRPFIAQYYFKSCSEFNAFRDNECGMTTAAIVGDRQQANRVYAKQGCDIVKANADGLPELSCLLPPVDSFGSYKVAKSGILEQLGRAYLQDNQDPVAVVWLACYAANMRNAGDGVKFISKWLRWMRGNLKTATASEIEDFKENGTLPPDRRA